VSTDKKLKIPHAWLFCSTRHSQADNSLRTLICQLPCLARHCVLEHCMLLGPGELQAFRLNLCLFWMHREFPTLLSAILNSTWPDYAPSAHVFMFRCPKEISVLFAWVALYEHVLLEHHLHNVVAVRRLSLWSLKSTSLYILDLPQLREDFNATASTWFINIENQNAMIVSTGG